MTNEVISKEKNYILNKLYIKENYIQKLYMEEKLDIEKNTNKKTIPI